MKSIKASKFNCKSKGVGKEVFDNLPNSNEFNVDESVVTAFSCDSAMFQYLEDMWDQYMSEGIPLCSGRNYGNTFHDFITSNDVEFKLTESDAEHINMIINYKGREDFFYELSVLRI